MTNGGNRLALTMHIYKMLQDEIGREFIVENDIKLPGRLARQFFEDDYSYKRIMSKIRIVERRHGLYMDDFAVL